MSNLPTVNPTTKLGSILNKVIRHANATTVQSKDLTMTNNGSGQSLTLSPNLRNFPSHFMNYTGEWNPDRGYNVDDVVRVLHDVVYLSAFNATETIHAVPGVYVCVTDIPNNYNSEFRKRNGDTTSEYVRVATTKYYPMYPEPVVTKDNRYDYDADFQANNFRYWELISLMPKLTTACVDGVNTSYYVDSVVSGSTV